MVLKELIFKFVFGRVWWSCSTMCATQTGVLFLSLSGSGGGNSNVYIKGLPAVLEGVGQVVCSTGFAKNVLSAPKLANFLLHLFQVGLAWCTIGIYHSTISAFWSLIAFTRHLIILSFQN